MRKLKVAVVAMLVFVALPIEGNFARENGVAIVEANALGSENADRAQVLSPMWSATIHQWSDFINIEAKASGLDPDFIAAVIHSESNGDSLVVSHMGAVGLMGVMPTGPGLEWRPPAETLTDPQMNLSWGVAILARIIQQSGGDLGAALAAYSGGWAQANSGVPKRYAKRVLNDYGRAVAVRSNISPEIASKWTVATEVTRGHIPVDPLILNEQPISGLRKFGEHVVYNTTDEDGRAYYVKGYAVPLALVVPLESSSESIGSDSVDVQLMARLGLTEIKINHSNPKILLACLPSLTRLRGQLATRWYAPSDCPSWHR